MPAATQKALRGCAGAGGERAESDRYDRLGRRHTRYAAALDILKRDESIDGLIVLFVSPLMINALEVAQAVDRRGCP